MMRKADVLVWTDIDFVGPVMAEMSKTLRWCTRHSVHQLDSVLDLIIQGDVILFSTYNLEGFPTVNKRCIGKCDFLFQDVQSVQQDQQFSATLSWQ